MKQINNKRNGYYLNSKYWQDWKKSLPGINNKQFQLMLGMVLSDASMYKISTYPYIKFEQGKDQKDFIYHLFEECQPYTFMVEPGVRYSKVDNTIKSYWFKTFSHNCFIQIWHLMYENNKKVIKNNIIYNNVDEITLAYWIMGDGSLHRDKRVITLHTQGFTLYENLIISNELNTKFGFQTKVIKHKNSFVVQFSSKDANKLGNIINQHMIPSMKYKVPRIILLLMI